MTQSSESAVAIITGASSGIGEATGRLLAKHGFKVVLAARRKDRLTALEDEIRSAGGEALAIAADVTDRAAIESMVGQTIDAFGKVDILVNNAGIMPLSPVRALKVDEWDRMIDVNIKGLLYCVAAVLPTMLKQKSGHIINVSSVAGRRAFPSGVIYSSTKFAVRAISEGLRLELSPLDNIRVTDIEPGVVATELTDHITDTETADRFKTNWADKKSLDSEDVAEAIRWVASQPQHVNVNELLVRPTDQPT